MIGRLVPRTAKCTSEGAGLGFWPGPASSQRHSEGSGRVREACPASRQPCPLRATFTFPPQGIAESMHISASSSIRVSIREASPPPSTSTVSRASRA